MTAKILYFNSDQYWDRQDEKRFALAERLGLDPDTELVSLPFPAIQRLPAPSASWRGTARTQSI